MLLAAIDKYTKINETLAISGQPSLKQFSLLRRENIQMVINLQIQEVDSVITDEFTIVSNYGMLYEEITVSFQHPADSSFHQFVDLLDQYKRLNILAHCTAGYCTSAFMIPYLVKYQGVSRAEAFDTVSVRYFAPHWKQFIEKMLANHCKAS